MPPLPFYDGEVVIETDPDQSQFTKRFTQRAVSFIEHHADQPFFLYMPHVMPHVPIFASRDFAGTSEHGLYGDVIQELDWSVGQILATLKRLEIDNNTLVIFFSDNGPWLSYGEHAGSATPLREGKLTTFEGGVRVPCLVRWPGKIPANRVNDEPFMSIDWLPTLTELVGGRPPNRKIDGLSVTPLLLGEPGAKSPHEALFFYARHRIAGGPQRALEAAFPASLHHHRRRTGPRWQALELGQEQGAVDHAERYRGHRKPPRRTCRAVGAVAVRSAQRPRRIEERRRATSGYRRPSLSPGRTHPRGIGRHTARHGGQ